MKIYSYNKKGDPEFWGLGDFNFNYQEIDKSILLNQGYSMNPYVFMVTDRIADKVASLPKVFCDSEGNKVDNKETQAFTELLSLNEGEKVLLEKCTSNLIALGEFFLVKLDSVGFEGVAGLEVVSPACVEIQTVNGAEWGQIKDFRITNYYKSTLNPDEVIFVKYPNIKKHTNRGFSPFEPLWDVVQASNNAFQAHGMLVRNMGANGIISPKMSAGDLSALGMQQDERTLLQRTIDRWFGSFGSKGNNNADNFGKTIITKTGIDFTQIGMDAQKLEILNMNKESLKVISSGVKLDSKMFNDAEASTYNNMAEVQKSAYIDCFIPTANYVMSSIAKELLPDDVYWKVDTEKIEVLNQRDQAREKETREGIIQVQNQVADGKITVDAGVATLEAVYDYDEDKAKALLDIPEQTNNI